MTAELTRYQFFTLITGFTVQVVFACWILSALSRKYFHPWLARRRARRRAIEQLLADVRKRHAWLVKL